MTKMMTKYCFDILHVTDGIEINLYRMSDGKKKQFFKAGESGMREDLVHHMNSLTDVQCDGYFPRSN